MNRRTRPKLSILVPAYNRPEMLIETLRSFENVTVDCEIVVVDDASPTDLSAVVERQAERDGRIRFLRNPQNIGATANFNKSFAEARGDYMCIIGDDDTTLPGNFEKKAAILDAHPEIGLVYSSHYYTDEANRPVQVASWPGQLPYSYVGGRDEFLDLFPWNYISLHSVVYRRRLFEQYGGFDEKLTECGNDWELNLRYCYHAPTGYINEPLLNVRIHGGAATRTRGFLEGKLALGRIQVWRKWLVDREPPLVLHERTWDVVRQLFARDINFWFQNDPAAAQGWLKEFEQLCGDHQAVLQRRFLGLTRALPAFAAEPIRPAFSTPPATSDVRPDAIPVVWEGGFFETHSLALVNRELALAMLERGEVDLSLRVRQLEGVKFDPRADLRLAPLLSRVDRQFDGDPAVHIRHAWPPVFEKPRAGKWVMVQPWEYGSLPVDWVPPMRDQVDEVWAYSEAVKRAYVDSGVPAGKVHVVPLGVDPEYFRPDVQPFDLPTRKRFRFLFVGGTIWRKGIDVLLQAYRRSFSGADDVSLVIKDMGQDSFYKGQGAAEAIARHQADPSAPEILYVTGAMSDKEIATLYTACHCLVHPYRGEGFGLPVAEAMACGLAVIVTKGGACDDFCGEDRAFFVPAERRPVDVKVPTASGAWVLEPNPNALADMMRTVYEAPDLAAERGRAASQWVRTNLTWSIAANKAMDRLKVLTGPPIEAKHAESSFAEAGHEAFNQGKEYLQSGHFGEAVEALTRAIALNPRLAGARYLRGCCYVELSRPGEALTEFDAALAARDNVSDLWNGRGCALRQLGRNDEAVAAFSRALALDPNNADAQANLAEIQSAPGTERGARGCHGSPVTTAELAGTP